jgi:hypothetical protein
MNSPVRRYLGATLGCLLLLLGFHCSWGGYSPPARPGPGIAGFSAARTVISAGDSVDLTAVFSFGLGSIDQGVGAVQSGVKRTVRPAADTTYTLTVLAPDGTSATGSLTVKVVALPQAPVITAPAAVTAGQTGLLASVPDQPGCTFAWSIVSGTINAGGSGLQITFSAAANGQLQLRCTATNAAGAQAQAVPVTYELGGATITRFLAEPATITAGSGTRLIMEFTGGTGMLSADDGSPETPVQSGEPLEKTPEATTAYTLTVTDDQQRTARQQVTVTVSSAPWVSSFSAAPRILGPGSSTTLTAVFNASDAAKAAVNGTAVQSGEALEMGPLQASTTFTLTLRELLGPPIAAAVRVLVGSLGVFAGTPSGQGSVDGTLLEARYRGLTGVAAGVDAGTGGVTFYLADTDNHTIRSISPDGVVSTLAGMEGQSGMVDDQRTVARFNGPAGLALANGTLCVADARNDSLRQVDPASGNIYLTTNDAVLWLDFRQ